MRLRCHGLFSVPGLFSTRCGWGLTAIGVWLGLASACQPPEPPAGRDTTAPVEFEPASEDGVVERAFRAYGPVTEPPLPRLFQGELSDYHRGRAHHASLPSTLTERLVPLWVEPTPEGVSLIPRRLLAAETTYSLVFSRAQVVELTTRNGPSPYRLIWPGAQTVRFAWWCRDGAEASPVSRAGVETPLRLSDGTDATLRWGPSGRPCFLISADARPSALGAISPPSLNGVSIDPVLFTQDSSSEDAVQASGDAAVCREDEDSLALGCVMVADDRMLLRGPDGGSLWWFGGDVEAVVPLVGTERAVLSGLSPGTEHDLELRVMTPAGDLYAGFASIHTSAVRPHVVLNEVMANPLGPEPQQEWVELVNDGALPVELAGFLFHDSGASVALPDVTLSPGEHALLVGPEFDADLGWDVPVQGRLLRVEALGKSGLSNSGEPLWLESPDGRIVSRFPPLPAKRAGVSLARRHPAALDDDTTAFGEHADPGASPGAPNTLPVEVRSGF